MGERCLSNVCERLGSTACNWDLLEKLPPTTYHFPSVSFAIPSAKPVFCHGPTPSVRQPDHNEYSNHEKFNLKFPYQAVSVALSCIVHHSAFPYHMVLLCTAFQYIGLCAGTVWRKLQLTDTRKKSRL
jgi:hypothetical protein